MFSRTDSQRRWLYQDSFTGCNDKLDILGERAWSMYINEKPVPFYATYIGKLRKFFRYSLWKFPKITAYLYKYQPTRDIMRFLLLGAQ